MKNGKRQGIFIPPGRKPWPHEMRVANVLSENGHCVEFLEEGSLHSPDILLDGVEYEIKSPENFRCITIERAIKKALKQSGNLIIDVSRMKNANYKKICNILLLQIRNKKQIKKMIMITKCGKMVDVFELL